MRHGRPFEKGRQADGLRCGRGLGHQPQYLFARAPAQFFCGQADRSRVRLHPALKRRIHISHNGSLRAVLQAVICNVACHYTVGNNNGGAAKRQKLFTALRAAAAHGIAGLNKALLHGQAAVSHCLPVGGKAFFGGRKPCKA